MRILAIRGKNLASLADEFEVLLHEGALANVGLFAITGQTGAGKSTILDALCLALYDKIPRLPDGHGVAIGRKDEDDTQHIKHNDVRSILRRGASHAYAEVDFIGKDKRAYRARWQVSKTQSKIGGKLQTQEVFLTDIATGEALGDNKKHSVLSLISERIGLNFEQFRRSVLLAQGDFAAFLKAKKDERSSLLERITGTELYSKLSIAAFERAKTEKQALDRLQDRIQAVLDKEQRGAIEQQQTLNTAQLADLEKRLSEHQAVLNWHEANKKYQNEVQQAQTEFNQHNTAWQQTEELRLNLLRCEAVQPLRPVLQQHQHAQRDYEEAEQKFKTAQHAHKAAEIAQQKAIVDVEQKTAAHQRAEQQHQQAQPVLKKVRELDVRLLTLQQDIKNLNRETAQLQNETHQARQDYQTLKQRYDQQQQDLGEPINLALLAEKKAELEQRAEQLTHTLNRLQLYIAEANAEQLGQQQKALELELLKKQISLDEAKKALKLIEASTHQDAAQLRSLLIMNEPCPVCGALEHPWQAQQPTHTSNAQQQRVDELDAEKNKLNSQIAETRQQLKQEQQRIAELNQRLLNSVPFNESLVSNAQHQLSIYEQQQQLNNQELAELKQQEKIALKQQALNELKHKLELAEQHCQQLEKQLTAKQTDSQEKQREQQHLLNERAEWIAEQLSADDLEQQLNQQLKQTAQAQTKAIDVLHQTQTEWATQKNAEQHWEQISSNRYDTVQQTLQTLNSELIKHNISQDELTALLNTTPEQLNAQKQQLEQLSDNRKQAQAVLESKTKDLNAHQSQQPELNQTQAVELNEQLKTEQKQLNAQKTELTLQLREDDNKLAANKKIQTELEAKQTQWKNWQSLNELIGSANGAKFRGFAQSLTLDSLIAHSNRHLADFAKRYALQRVPNSDLELQIIDQDMANDVRSVHSLSGGESFLVSLALALGLASLSANQTQVESLFIDEGFGSLDPETLDIAIASLDTLQSLGRKVGIISHVPILVERIGARVVVKKQGGGKSSVSIMAG